MFFSFFIITDELVGGLSSDGLVDSVPLDNFMKIGHESDDFMSNLSDLGNIFNIDVIECSYFFLKKRDNERLKRSIGRNNDIISDDLIIELMIECFKAYFEFLDDIVERLIAHFVDIVIQVVDTN